MKPPAVFIVDDDPAVRDGLALLLEASGLDAHPFESAETFLAQCDPDRWGCVILDVRMAGMSGPQLHDEMLRRGWHLPVIYLTGHGDIPMSVRAIKSGAVDFLTKPVSGDQLLEQVNQALQSQRAQHEEHEELEARKQCFARLTPREMEVLLLALAGHNNKEIGRRLDISFRTVEIHRSRVLQKTGATNMLELAHISMNLGLSAAMAPPQDAKQKAT
jgi:RNA polymerase sigma factor (sigma-70 family)